MRILLVEDDENLAEMLNKYLIGQHYTVDLATNGQAGWDLAAAFEYELILLDVMLPDLDGISFCKQLRQLGDRTPILMLTAYDSSTDKVTGLDAGADDYVIKPYNFDELSARIRALLRRGNAALPPTIAWENLRLDPSICEVTYNGQLLHLTTKEYAILDLLLRNTHRIFSQNALLDRLWSFDEPPLGNTVRAHIKSLRRKLNEAGGEDLIETVHGLGYRLREISQVTDRVPLTNTEFKKNHQVSPELISIWEQSYAKYSDRITILEEAVTALLADRFTNPDRQQAARAAHTPIGSLGSFGLNDAAQLCRQIEQLLTGEIDRTEITDLAELVRQLRGCLAKSAPIAQSQTIRSTVVNQSGLKPRLLIVDDDPELNALLIAEATAWGIQADAVTNIADARSVITQSGGFSNANSKLDVVLLDLSFPDSTENGLALLKELANDEDPLSVVVFTARSSFRDRLEIARLGAQSFLQKPISPRQVIESIVKVLQQTTKTEAKLLIVDDDPQILDFLMNLLSPWGFNLTLLDDPHQFWQTLNQTAPDLLILDIEMPSFSGIELCQVVRNDPEWSELPILFLSVHQDIETIDRVFTVGGDDYVNKPIIGSALIARILNRLERTRMLRKLSDRIHDK
jgi:DNA-binding response OmpR family regulator/HPt (histidine-containing phosphotransfer) domain-containing protein